MCLESSLARTLPTLPSGGSTSRSLAVFSFMMGVGVGWGIGLMGLNLAAASFAAMLEGEATSSAELSSGTARLLELLDGLNGCIGDA